MGLVFASNPYEQIMFYNGILFFKCQWHVLIYRFNKLGLDTISKTEDPPSCFQVEEVHTFQSVQSSPLNVEKILYIDIGTAHSAAVMGETRILRILIFCTVIKIPA